MDECEREESVRESEKGRIKGTGDRRWRKVKEIERAQCGSQIEGKVRSVGHRAGDERERLSAGDKSGDIGWRRQGVSAGQFETSNGAGW